MKEALRVPDLLVERLALGELDPGTAASVRARLAAEPGGAERLAAIATSDQTILTAHPAEAMARRIKARAAQVGPSAPPASSLWARWWPVLPTLAAAAIAVIVIQPWAHVAPDDGVRTKGVAEPSLTLFRQTEAGAELLAPASPAHEGDRLLVHYTAAAQRYGMVLSIDGNGVVTQHLPVPADHATQAATLSSAPATPLPLAYELDAAPAFERFFLVTRAEPFPIDVVTAASRALAADIFRARAEALALPKDMHQTSILVVKAPAPSKHVAP